MAIGNLKDKILKSGGAQRNNAYSPRTSGNDKEIIDRIKGGEKTDPQRTFGFAGSVDEPGSEEISHLPGESDGVEQNLDHQYEPMLMPSAKAAERKRADIDSYDEEWGEKRGVSSYEKDASGSAGQDAGRTVILTGIILDGTLSFVTVFPAVYYALERFLRKMEGKQREYTSYSFKYGLTILHDKAEAVSFSGTYFTSRVEEVLEEIRSMKFYGGSGDGREDLRGAINIQLETLNVAFEEEQGRVFSGLLMFTDALPPENEMSPDFQDGEPGVYGDYTNHGLRFAEFFVHNDEDFTPRMRHVDKRGVPSLNIKNCTRIHSIRELIPDDAEAAPELVGDLVDQILNQTSVDLIG